MPPFSRSKNTANLRYPVIEVLCALVTQVSPTQEEKMKGSNSTIIPIEPDSQIELEKVLKAGESAKVMLAGSDTLFIMKKAEKGNDYELSQVISESSNEGMRKALGSIKELIK